MAVNITTTTVKVALSSGEKTFYNINVVDSDTGQTKESISTANPTVAKLSYEEFKTKHPGSTTNGGYDNPFEDGSIQSPENYEPEGLMSTPPPVSAAASNVQAKEGDIRDFSSSSSPSAKSLNMSIGQSSLTKKARDLSGMSKQRKENYEKLSEKDKAKKKLNGVFGNKRLQAMPKREDVDSEKIVGRGPDNNAFIVIGNDRVSKPHTGYGGKGHTQCDAIDIVVGLGGHNPKEVDSSNEEIKTNPHFFIDSARIYLSQKTDVDRNFGIGEFGLSEESSQDNKDSKNDAGKYAAKSAIALKADNVRLIGRESIRLVTGTDSANSQGGEVLSKSGIEIIAMNDTTTLQPMVLGDNLQTALITIVNNISALAKITHGYMKYQMKYNQALQTHTHITPFFGLPALISESNVAAGIKCDIETSMKSELSTLKHLTNLQGVKMKYLTESGGNYINSRLNKVN